MTLLLLSTAASNFTIAGAGKDHRFPEPDQEEHHRIYCFVSRKNHPLKQDPIIS
jgi:hypothetical protein